MKFIKSFRNNYVINQVHRQKLPVFTQSEVKRYQIHFKGRVQKVGFRLEVCEMSKRLGVVGYCRNMEDGSVIAELQGEVSKIDYLLNFMKSLKRIKIVEMKKEEITLRSDEVCVERM